MVEGPLAFMIVSQRGTNCEYFRISDPRRKIRSPYLAPMSADGGGGGGGDTPAKNISGEAETRRFKFVFESSSCQLTSSVSVSVSDSLAPDEQRNHSTAFGSEELISIFFPQSRGERGLQGHSRSGIQVACVRIR